MLLHLGVDELLDVVVDLLVGMLLPDAVLLVLELDDGRHAGRAQVELLRDDPHHVLVRRDAPALGRHLLHHVAVHVVHALPVLLRHPRQDRHGVVQRGELLPEAGLGPGGKVLGAHDLDAAVVLGLPGRPVRRVGLVLVPLSRLQPLLDKVLRVVVSALLGRGVGINLGGLGGQTSSRLLLLTAATIGTAAPSSSNTDTCVAGAGQSARTARACCLGGLATADLEQRSSRCRPDGCACYRRHCWQGWIGAVVRPPAAIRQMKSEASGERRGGECPTTARLLKAF